MSAFSSRQGGGTGQAGGGSDTDSADLRTFSPPSGGGWGEGGGDTRDGRKIAPTCALFLVLVVVVVVVVGRGGDLGRAENGTFREIGTYPILYRNKERSSQRS